MLNIIGALTCFALAGVEATWGLGETWPFMIACGVFILILGWTS